MEADAAKAVRLQVSGFKTPTQSRTTSYMSAQSSNQDVGKGQRSYAASPPLGRKLFYCSHGSVLRFLVEWAVESWVSPIYGNFNKGCYQGFRKRAGPTRLERLAKCAARAGTEFHYLAKTL